MNYVAALKIVHRLLRPRTYVEIGCHFGDSLKLVDCPMVGIDPNNKLKYDFGDQLKFFEERSDEFFEKRTVRDVLGTNFDFGFIDGMHLVEFSLRDFINMEANANPESIIVIDDMLPEHNDYCGRKKITTAWTGDVYRLLAILKEYRPDLRITAFSVIYKGFTIVDQLDPKSTVLSDNLDEIMERIGRGDFMVDDVSELVDLHKPMPPEMLEPWVKENLKPFS